MNKLGGKNKISQNSSTEPVRRVFFDHSYFKVVNSKLFDVQEDSIVEIMLDSLLNVVFQRRCLYFHG